MLTKCLIIVGVLLIITGLIILLRKTKICEGGELFANQGCGKILFPWSKKIKLTSGKVCCVDCYAKDLRKFVELRKVNEKQGLSFTLKEEEQDNNE